LICVFQLGRVTYSEGLRLQQKLVELRKENRIGDALLLLEHDPVITLGRNAKAANILASPEQLAERGVEVVECNRGGDVTFHGGGQLVGYPILDLRGLHSAQAGGKTMGVIEYVRNLEQVLIGTCADLGIATQTMAGLTGVWTHGQASGPDFAGAGEDTGKAKLDSKIAAIGVHISRGVTSHGFALNVNTDLSFFHLIIPCGISSRPVTSMEKELNRTVALEAVAHSVARNFGVVFASQMLWPESLDAWLGAATGVPLKLPTELRMLRQQNRRGPEEEETFWA
jgi:lipoyl(octanoyl) transferase